MENPKGFRIPQKDRSEMTEEEFQRVLDVFRLLSKWDRRQKAREKETPPSTGTEESKDLQS